MDIPYNAPQGYRWHGSDAVLAAVLIPDGWYVHEQTKGSMHEVLAFLPDLEHPGECLAALTLNAMHHVSRVLGITARSYGAQSVKTIKGRHQTLFDVETATEEGTMSWAVRFRSVLSATPRIVHRYMLADDGDDLLRWCTFEAPEDRWKQAWPTGEFILRHLCMVLSLDVPSPEGEQLH